MKSCLQVQEEEKNTLRSVKKCIVVGTIKTNHSVAERTCQLQHSDVHLSHHVARQRMCAYVDEEYQKEEIQFVIDHVWKINITFILCTRRVVFDI